MTMRIPLCALSVVLAAGFDGHCICRCDLHPRWRPDGKQIGFNSVREGSRQVYVMDVK